MPDKWQHLVDDVVGGKGIGGGAIIVHTDVIQRRLDELGAEGWELVAVSGPLLYLKRRAGYWPAPSSRPADA